MEDLINARDDCELAYKIFWSEGSVTIIQIK